MLFLYRPPQTYMPFGIPRTTRAQSDYNREMQARFQATRRVPAPTPSRALPHDAVDDLRRLGELHDSGVLTDEEFAEGKARILDAGARA